jgi:hypothetical protein
VIRATCLFVAGIHHLLRQIRKYQADFKCLLSG